jgi:hypothetical protein
MPRQPRLRSARMRGDLETPHDFRLAAVIHSKHRPMEESLMVKRKKEAPPLPDGGAKDCATDQKRAANIEPPTTTAKPRSYAPRVLMLWSA